MGYHDDREIPNYWAYASNFVLQDHMFEPNTLVEPARAPVHGVASGRRAATTTTPDSCTQRRRPPGRPAGLQHARSTPDAQPPTYAWTDLTYLLHRAHVSWRYYVVHGRRAGLRGRRAASPARR